MVVLEYIFEMLQINRVPNMGDAVGFVSIFLLVLLSMLNILAKGENKKESKVKVTETKKTSLEEVKPVEVSPVLEEAPVVVAPKGEPEVEPEAKPEPKPEPKVSWSQRLFKGLAKSRNDVWGKIGSILSGDKISDDEIEQIEEILFTADLPPTLVDEMLETFKSEVAKGTYTPDFFQKFVHKFISDVMEPVQTKVNPELYGENSKNGKMKVIMVVGVNGAGKTTTIGKLATRLKNSGASVVVGACDTFRAAAIEQLEVWAKRADVELIKAQHGSDPSGVAYDTLAKAQSLNADYCILDTAGRLHTHGNLMEELKKTKRVLSKLDVDAPHEVLLVVDAITGQNALRQAEEFNKALALTGLVFTKCDGSAKAGSAVSIVKNLQVPIAYIGVGEDVEDLDKFELNEYLNALIGA